jgi:hypothetical protein
VVARRRQDLGQGHDDSGAGEIPAKGVTTAARPRPLVRRGAGGVAEISARGMTTVAWAGWW